MAPEVPAHFHTEKVGDVWRMVCLHCGAFIGAAPVPEALTVAAEVHSCERKMKPGLPEKPITDDGQQSA